MCNSISHKLAHGSSWTQAPKREQSDGSASFNSRTSRCRSEKPNNNICGGEPVFLQCDVLTVSWDLLHWRYWTRDAEKLYWLKRVAELHDWDDTPDRPRRPQRVCVWLPSPPVQPNPRLMERSVTCSLSSVNKKMCVLSHLMHRRQSNNFIIVHSNKGLLHSASLLSLANIFSTRLLLIEHLIYLKHFVL